MTLPAIGHNRKGAPLRVEARLFNSLTRYIGSGGVARQLELEPGATVGDVIQLLGVPLAEIFLVLRNGRDITPGVYQGGAVRTELALEDGDVIAFSGPVPYSFGYGAPVV
jgi:hypothetical protein